MNTLSMVEIIEETVKFYGEDVNRRCFFGDSPDYGCVYTNIYGQHCAIGRCLTEEALEGDPDQHANANVGGVWKDMVSLDRDLLPQYRGHSMKFWSRLQHLHDCPKFWNSRGITEEGRSEALDMMSLFV